MKIQKTIKWAAAIAAICLAAHTASAQQYIGVNFTANDNAGPGAEAVTNYGIWSGPAVDALLPTDVAGAYPQANWNNVGMFGTNVVLNGSNGVPSGVTMTWNSPGMWHANGATTAIASFPALSSSPNAKLMDSYLECTWNAPWSGLPVTIDPGTSVINMPAGDQPVIFLSGLDTMLAGVGGGTYSVIIYMNTGNQCDGTRNGAYWLDSVTAGSTWNSIVDVTNITPQLWGVYNTVFTNAFVQLNPLATNLASADSGNFIDFGGLTNAQVLIRVSDNLMPGISIAGIQVTCLGLRVPPVPNPPLFSPTNVVFGGSPITLTENLSAGTPPNYFQWQTDGGSGPIVNYGSSTTNSPNTLPYVALNTGSTYPIQFDCVVSNTFGISTSSVVTLTVLPQSKPILTTDIGVNYTNVYGFIGGPVNFNANFYLGTMPITNNWLYSSTRAGTFGAISGASSSAWTLTNVLSGSSGWYELAATNAIGSSNSSPAHLAALADPAAPSLGGVTNMYAYCVYTNGPLAYWRFEETNDTFNSSMQAYDYSGHNYDATYLTSGTPGTGALDGGETLSNIGLNGPTPIINGHAIYSGFPANNGCASLTKDSANGYLTVPPLNINTNTVTFTMWLYANSGVVYANSGLLMWRNGHDGAGVGFCGTIYSNVIQGISMPYLGYTWNNNGSATYSWSSGLALPSSTWSFAAWVLTPTNTTVYLYYVSGGKTNLSKSVLNIANNPESFSGGQTFLGADPQVPGGGRTFDGSIDEVAVFTNSMTESQIQDLFLKSIGLLSGVPPTITVPPASTTCFQGQTLQLSAAATGIPSPSYQWQFELGTTTSWASMSQSTATGIGAPTNSVVNWYNYSGAYTNFRVIAINPYGKATSSVPIAVVTMIPLTNFNKGLWTVNFDVITANNSGPDVPYVGPGVLGTNYLGTNGLGATIPIYWNALSGSTFASTPPTLLMDGVTKTTVNLGATNYGNGSFFGAGAFGGFPTTNLLRDQFMSFPTNGTAMVFTGVPTGVYNLAVYASVGGYTNRGVVLTVGGVTQSLTNAQDQQFLPDNTAFFPNLLVTSGSLEVDMKPLASTLLYPTNTEGDFNGAQLELIKAGPGISSLTNNGGNFVLSWVGGGLYSSTNVMPGPWWGTNPAVSPYTFAPTGATRFFKIFNPTFPN